MKKVNIVGNRILEEKYQAYCRKIEEKRLGEVKASLKIDTTRITINNSKKVFAEKMRNQEIQRNNTLLKKRLEELQRKTKKIAEEKKKENAKKLNTPLKNYLLENIKSAKVKKEVIKKVPELPKKSETIKKKIVYKGYIDDAVKNFKFYIELSVDDDNNLKVVALNLKNKKLKKIFYDKMKHVDLLAEFKTYKGVVDSLSLVDAEESEQNVSSKKKGLLNKQKGGIKEIKKSVEGKKKIEKVDEVCEFYIKEYFKKLENQNLSDLKVDDSINEHSENIENGNNKIEGKNSVNDTTNIDNRNKDSQNNESIKKKLIFSDKEKYPLCLLKTELMKNPKINEEQAKLIYKKIELEMLKKEKELKKTATLNVKKEEAVDELKEDLDIAKLEKEKPQEKKDTFQENTESAITNQNSHMLMKEKEENVVSEKEEDVAYIKKVTGASKELTTELAENDATEATDALKEVVKEETVDEEVVKEENVKEEVAKEETVKEDVAKEETVDEEVMKEETVKEEVAKEENVKEEVVKEETVEEEVVKEETVKEEVAKEETIEKVVKEETVEKEVVKEETVKEEVAKEETIEKEVVKEETVKEEVAKEETIEEVVKTEVTEETTDVAKKNTDDTDGN